MSKPVFMAATALDNFWQTDGPVLFLTEACRLYDRRSIWQNLEAKVLPYPWNSPDELALAAQYCHDVYERLLPEVAENLNRVHQTHFTQRYWRIVVGEWLSRYIQIVFERYTLLKEAFKIQPDLQTVVLDEHCYKYVRNNQEFIEYTASDIYNLQIYSQLLKGMGYSFPTQKCGGRSAFLEEDASEWMVLFKKAVEVIEQDQKLLFYGLSTPDVCFSGLELPRMDIQTLQGRRIAGSQLNFGVETIAPSIKKEERKVFGALQGKGPFETFCFQLLEYSLPLAYLEGFQAVREKVNRLGFTHPKLIFSTINWRWETLTSIYIAQCVEKGSRLIGVQPEGGYGSYAVDCRLDYELETVDSYISWGWEDTSKKIMGLPHPGLSQSKKKYKSKEEANVLLFVGRSAPRYMNSLQSCPSGGRALEYFLAREKFFHALSPKLRAAIWVRLEEPDYGWKQKERLKEIYPELRFDPLKTAFGERLKTALAVVVDYNATAYLESIAFDIPTIFFWNPDLWPLHRRSKFYFDQLKEAKVFHPSADAAAIFLNNNFENIEEWWNSSKVKEAVNNFRLHFARVSDEWKVYWDNAIKREWASQY